MDLTEREIVFLETVRATSLGGIVHGLIRARLDGRRG